MELPWNVEIGGKGCVLQVNMISCIRRKEKDTLEMVGKMNDSLRQKMCSLSF
jgi:hypothetical protein